jgi:hypothetical protein
MPSSIINSDDGVVSGTSGIKTTGGDDGVLVFQSKGTETARINTDKQIVAAAGTASLPIYSTTGDLNTGIYFPSADTIGFAEGGAQCGEFDSSANFKFNSGYGSVATAYGCRAWVNFNGTTSPGTIRASGNVSSVTKNGTGDYTVNFTTAMPDANYAITALNSMQSSNNRVAGATNTYSTTSCQITVEAVTSSFGGSRNDSTSVFVSIFR